MTKPDDADSTQTRAGLIRQLKDWQDHDGWTEFFETYWRLIYSLAVRAGLSNTEAEEVVQETVVAVARRMPTFTYDENKSFKAWLLQIAQRRIVDQFRKRPLWERAPQNGGDGDHRTPPLERLLAPAADATPDWDEEWRKNLVDAALRRVKARVAPRHYQVFDLHVVKECPVGEVARTLEVSAAQVYLVKHRLARLVREEMQRLEKRWSAAPTGADRTSADEV